MVLVDADNTEGTIGDGLPDLCPHTEAVEMEEGGARVGLELMIVSEASTKARTLPDNRMKYTRV